MGRILLLVPCNSWVRFGDYTLGDNWRTVHRAVGDFVETGIVDMASVDSCKPGIVYQGEEYRYIWCDVRPLWHELYKKQSWRLEALTRGLEEDLRDAAVRYRAIAGYINVKAYRLALEEASRRTRVKIWFFGPEAMSPLSFRSRRNLGRLRRGLEALAQETRVL